MKNKVLELCFIIAVILLFASMVFFFSVYLKNDGVACLDNPMYYYQIKENTTCMCTNMFIINP